MYKRLMAMCAVLFMTACNSCNKTPVGPTEASVPTSTGTPQLTIKNDCSYQIWIQQQGMPSPTPSVVAIPAGSSTAYNIPAAGLPSTRFWPKTGCDASGNNCTLGQSSPPCPANGCSPPVDSKIEATWGCLLQDPNQCAVNPSSPDGGRLDSITWWNASAVDGYTLPFTIVASPLSAQCPNVDCAELSQTSCPTNANLTTDGKFPQYASQNEVVAGEPGACFSPCDKLTDTAGGADGIQPPSDPRAIMYCCPGAMSAACRAGPVVKTDYVKIIHTLCHGTTYGYAYDDGIGLRSCPGTTTFTMTFCPPIPAK